MKVGFTGSREGMTEAQLRAFRKGAAELFTDPSNAFHHGCCVGADEQAAVAVRAHHTPAVSIIGHPPSHYAQLSETACAVNDENHDPRPYLDRNRDIVDASDVLMACPKGPEEQRSGTWATVRYGRRKGKRIVIVWPDGTVTEESAK